MGDTITFTSDTILTADVIETIPSCPDCMFLYIANTPLYTSWNVAGEDPMTGDPIPVTPTVLTSGLYYDYQALVATTGKEYFMGVKLDSNNQIERAYGCGIKNNVPFCIEGTLGPEFGGTSCLTAYLSNKSVLLDNDIYGNTCSVSDSGIPSQSGYTQCGPWNNSTMSTYIDTIGNVGIGIDYDYDCGVDPDGVVNCDELAGN